MCQQISKKFQPNLVFFRSVEIFLRKLGPTSLISPFDCMELFFRSVDTSCFKFSRDFFFDLLIHIYHRYLYFFRLAATDFQPVEKHFYSMDYIVFRFVDTFSFSLMELFFQSVETVDTHRVKVFLGRSFIG